ncbi:MAG: DUF2273 domain-containing protein [Candidatus Bipolaricaulia bacterium]
MTNLSRAWTGALLGGLVGLLWVWLSFSGMLLVLALAVIGAVLGQLLESDELRAKLRELSDVVFRRS